MHVLPTLGRILSYGYLAYNFIPVCIAFPTLLCLLLGPTTAIPDCVLIDSFLDCLGEYEAGIVREAISSFAFSNDLKTKLLGVFSRFGCRELPTWDNIKDVVNEVARYEFLVKPMAAISKINSGVPSVHVPFWKKQSVEDMRRLYTALTATPAKVIEAFVSEASNPCEERVMSYLEQFIGNMSKDVLRRFLRFTTGI